MSITATQFSRDLPRRLSVTIKGNGAVKTFTIAHNLETDELIVVAREVQDSLKQVYLDNFPDPTDPMNKLIVSFDFAPAATDEYKILIVG